MSSIHPCPASAASLSEPVLSGLYNPASGRTRYTLIFDVWGDQTNFGGRCLVPGWEDSRNMEENVQYHQKEEFLGVKEQMGAGFIELKGLGCQAAPLAGLEQLQGSGQNQPRYKWYTVPAYHSTSAFKNNSCNGDDQEDSAEKLCNFSPIMLGILNPPLSNQGTISASPSKQASPSPCHNHQTQTRVKSAFVCAAFHQQSEHSPGMGSAIADGSVETRILEDVRLPCSFLSPSRESIGFKSIQDSGAAVSIVRASIPVEAKAEIVDLEEPIHLTTVLGEKVELTQAASLDLELPCFAPGETRRIKFHLVPDEKMKNCADAYLSPSDAQMLGHMIVVHCKACSDAKVLTGHNFFH